MKIIRTLAAAMLGLIVSVQSLSQATLPRPQLGDAPLPSARVGLPQLGLSADEVLSPAQEKALGRIIWRDLRSEPDVLTDTLITDYLQQLTRKLAKQLDLPEAIVLRTFAVADPQLNAFAVPSGLMGVHTGLILNVAREGELAAVMAHEIGHVSQRHFARGLANKKGDQWIALAGFAAALIAARSNSAQSGQVIEGALVGSQALTASRQLSFSRDMEREADAIGFELMRSAEYDGADMVRMLRRLGASSAFSEISTGYAKSHPGTSERMANIEGRLRVGSAANRSAQPATLDFLLAQARVRALTARSPDQIEEAHAYFVAQLEQNKTMHLAVIAAQYGLCQLAIQRKQWLNAQQHWRSLAAGAVRHPWFNALDHELMSVLNQTSSSNDGTTLKGGLIGLSKSLSSHLSQVPTSSSAAQHIVQTALRSEHALIAQDIQAASTATDQWLVLHPIDDMAWAARANLYAAQRLLAQALWAQAEQTAAMGIWPSSVNALVDALRMGEASVPVAQQNQWRERLRTIRQIADDEKGLLDKLK